MYDIRKEANDPPVSNVFVDYLNLPSTRNALGVDVSYAYEASSRDVYLVFQQSGDYVYPSFLEDMGFLLDSGIRVV